MNIKMNQLSRAVLQAIAIGVGASFVTSAIAQAPTPAPVPTPNPPTTTAPAAQTLEKIEVTGSSIKRIEGEGALPVTVITRAAIAQTGVQSLPDLIQALPSMQGFTTASASVNGGGGGVQTAALHSLDEKYTLVLLNGRRVAPFNTGSGVNLASIPLAAIERVEILSDGASALYGSDAIAGVVNIILRKNSEDGSVELNYNVPEKSGGKSFSLGVTKGFGNLDKDGYNVMVSLSHDDQDDLNAADRKFSRDGGVRPFSYNGQNYSLFQLSSNTFPAGVQLTLTDGTARTFSPDFYQSSCGPNTFPVGNYCRYNFASTVQLIPVSHRNGVVASGNLKINNDTRAFVDLMYSDFKLVSRFAPPAQPLAIPASSPLYTQFITPYLSRLAPTATGPVTAADVARARINLRLVDSGGRTNEFATLTKHVVTGVEGNAFNWEYNLSLTHSEQKSTDSARGGYLSQNAFNAIVASGAYNPFLPASSAGAAALKPAVLNYALDSSKSTLQSVNVRTSREIFQLGGGAAGLGLGLDVSRQRYKDDPSPILQTANALQPDYTDSIIGGAAGNLPFDSSRKVTGTFAELSLPVMKILELTGAVRYDSFSKVTNKQSFDSLGKPQGSAEQGIASNGVTYKLSARLQPTQNFLMRASYGTGFRAPSLGNISTPISFNGSTGFQNCPFRAPNPLAAGCQPPGTEYDALIGGNSSSGPTGLKPEKSKQFTVGFRVDPIPALSFGADVWQVKLRDKIDTVSENVAFRNADSYAYLFSVVNDPIGQFPTLGFLSAPINLASSKYSGIDWDTTVRIPNSVAPLTLQWTGTYMMKADNDFPGIGTQSSLGKFGPDNNVISRVQSRLTASTKIGMFAHALTATYKSGYLDSPASEGDGVIRVVNPNGTLGDFIDFSGRRVASYTTFDWQTRADVTKALQFTLGVKNMFDRQPPFSIRFAGGGNALGYDGRYTDPLGRNFYVKANYKF
jgi:iron complex outermembrane recepter protein